MASTATFLGRDALGELWSDRRKHYAVLIRRIRLPLEASEEVTLEVTAAASLAHPNIFKPLEVGARDGLLQVVSEAATGRTLRDVLTALAAGSEKLALSDAVYIAIQLFEAADHAHSHLDSEGKVRPIVHGRISPEQVVITEDGAVHLTGFGLDAAARIAISEGARFDPGFAYIAPEQCSGQAPSRNCDVFSIASILGEMLIGEPLFLQSTFKDTFEAIEHTLMPDIRGRRQGVPLALHEALACCLEKSPDKRWGAQVAAARITAFLGILQAGDRAKPGEHPKRLANVLRRRLSLNPVAVGVTSGHEILDFDVADGDPIITNVVGSPMRRRASNRGRTLRLFAAMMVVGLAAATFETWPLAKTKLEQWLPVPWWPAQAVLGAPPEGSEPPLEAPAVVTAAPLAEEPAPQNPILAAVPAPSKPAIVSITTRPASIVFLNGTQIGRTPIKAMSIPAGKHRFMFLSKRPKKRVTKEVTLVEGEEKKLKFDLRKR